MSAFNDLDMTCPDCGEEFRGTVWTAVHAGQDPELKDLMLGGELNMVMCERCMQVSFYENFLIYHDPEQELLAYVYPESQADTQDDMDALMRSGFAESQKSLGPKHKLKYEPVLVFGLATLVETQNEERIMIDQSDVAEAVCLDHEIPLTRLRPYESRRLKLPRVLPGVSEGRPNREQLLEGIKRLLKADPVLDRYKTLRDVITADPTWEFPT